MAGVFGTALGMGFHGTLGAAATTDFGKKGMAVGGAFGAGSFLVGEMLQDDENPTLGGAVASGLVSGSMQSAFSSAQEVFAFHNPGHVSNVSSINNTTSATAIANTMYLPFTEEGKSQWKELRQQESVRGNGKKKSMIEAAFDMGNTNMMTSENMLTDATRMAMISNDIEGGADKMLRLLGIDRSGSGGFNPVSALKGQYADMFEAAKVADDGGVWFDNKAKTIDIEQKTFFGQKLNEKGERLTGEYFSKSGDSPITMPNEVEVWGMGKDKWMKENDIDESKTKYYVEEQDETGQRRRKTDEAGNHIESKPHTNSIDLTGKETMAERMGIYLEQNRHAYDSAIKYNAMESSAKGKTPRFTDFEGYKDYVTSMDGGALGTYQELRGAGYYDKESSFLKKSIAYGTETAYGSPAWARILDKQLESGKVELDTFTSPDGYDKVRIKGGGKGARIMGLVADVATGGAMNAALNVAMFTAAAPFRSNNGSTSIQTNQGYAG